MTAAEAVVVVQWLASTHDATTAWASLVALCLFVFRIVIALMALTPVTATVGRSILLRWSRRSGWIVVATIGAWALVLPSPKVEPLPALRSQWSGSSL